MPTSSIAPLSGAVRVGDAPVADVHRAWRAALWLAWILLLVLGLIGLGQRIEGGHLPAGYGSYVPWGLWIAIYFHGVGLGAGAFLVAALGHLMGWRGFRHPAALRVAVVLAFATVLPGLLAVWFDLGHMDRATRILTSPNFLSMMAFNAWLYQVFLGVAAAVYCLSWRARSGWLRPLLILGCVVALMMPSQSGAFFGAVDAKAYWHSALIPLLFLTSAITAGAALLLFVRGMIGCGSPAGSGDRDPAVHRRALSRLRWIVLVGLVLYFVMEFAEYSVALWSPLSHSAELDLVLWGPYWWVFWIVHLLLGGVLPLVLFARSSPGGWTLGAALVAVTFLSSRLNVLVPGQATSDLKGLQEAYQHPRLDFTYHATAMEYFVGALIVAVGMAIFYVGRFLSVHIARRRAALSEL